MHHVTITRISRAGALAALAAASLLAAGCSNSGTKDSADVVAGKALFVEKCGSCHTLNRAGTKGTVGPNLDAAFQNARDEDQGDEAIRGVVLGQILYPSKGAMPAKIVEGDDAQDIAAYVGQAAARPGKDAGLLAEAGQTAANTPPKQVFAKNCGSCHTLAAAGTSGSTGPNLDTLKPDAARVSKQVIAGGGAMPAFKGTLSDAQIAALAKYVADAAGQ